MFSCEFCEFSKNTFFTEHLWANAVWIRQSFMFILLRGSLVCILFMSSERLGFFKLNFETQLQSEIYAHAQIASLHTCYYILYTIFWTWCELKFTLGTLFDIMMYTQYLLHEKCPNTEFFLVLIQSEYRKIRTKKTPYFDTLHAVFRQLVRLTFSNLFW